jgi:alpha-tubulin suppressor-like RCC1 family protein
VNALNRSTAEHRAGVRRSGRRGVIRLAALMALLTLGASASPALGSTASPGQLYAFGRNYYGQLGNETNLNGEPNFTPALVNLPGEIGPVTQAAGGAGFSLVATSSGQLYSFGRNYYGQLGNESNVGSLLAANPTPTLVTLPGATGPVIQLAAGLGHSLVVTATGQLFAFGYNWFGQLGNTTNNRTEEPNPTPTLVTLPGASGPVTQVAAGGFHSLALTSTGQLYAFGDNNAGQLGTATKSPTGANPTPTLVTLPGATGPITQISAGEFFSLVVTATGQLYAFGDNRLGQLGNTTNNRTEEPNPTPTRVTLPGASGPVSQVAAGDDHSLALTSTGQLYAFGENRFGELGNTTNNETEEPNPAPTRVTLPGASGLPTHIAAGYDYSLALTSTGHLYAFGSDYGGELGLPPGTPRDAPHPTPMRVLLPGGANIAALATGPRSDHTFVVSQLGLANSSLPAGETGVPYSTLVQGIGGVTPYTWAASGLPPGLAINQTNGTISGTPTTTGSYTPTITLTDNYDSQASIPVTTTIMPPPSVRSETLPAGQVGVPYSALVQGIGGVTPYTWAASGLPPGLAINQTNGTISGTPTTTGSYTPTITLTDNYDSQASIQLTTTITASNEPSPPNETPPPSETPPPPPPTETPPRSFPNEMPSSSGQQQNPLLSALEEIPLRPSVHNARQSATRWRERNQIPRISHAKVPTGTTFTFSLNEQATVHLSFTQVLPQGGDSCLARTHENIKRKSCNTAPTGTLSFAGHSGKNKVVFTGRLSQTNELKPGRYELTITATNPTGQSSTPVSLSFTISK